MSNKTKKSDAVRLAAVLNVLRYQIEDGPDGPDEETEWMAYAPRCGGLTGPQVVRLVHQGEGYSLEIEPWSKSDLARIVAILTPVRRGRFDMSISTRSDTFPCDPEPSKVITAPSSTWLDALCVATGVE